MAVDYSARDAIISAARSVRASAANGDPASAANGDAVSRDDFAWLLSQVLHEEGCASDVDLLVRTGGERRLSDFLLWECAYAELYFTEVMWPDFNGETLAAALADFRGRERRFGRVPDQAAG